MLKIFIFLLLLVYSIQSLYAQKLAEDTAFFEFKPSPPGLSDVCIKHINDSRGVPSNWVSTGSKKRYLLIPADVLIYNREPMARALHRGFQNGAINSPCYTLDIRQLRIDYRSGFVWPSYVFSAIIPVYQETGDTMLLKGSMVYNEDFKKHRGEDLKTVCSRILYKWYPQFQKDLSITMRNNPSDSLDLFKNRWFPGEIPVAEHLNIGLSGAIGVNWWQTEAEVWFSGVETNQRTVFTSSILRYQNQQDFESIAIGKGIEHIRYRLSSILSYDASFSMLIGINKWKNMKEMNPTLYQIAQLNISSVHSLVLGKANRRGILLKAGVQGQFYFIYDKKPGIQAGLYLGTGYIY